MLNFNPAPVRVPLGGLVGHELLRDGEARDPLELPAFGAAVIRRAG